MLLLPCRHPLEPRGGWCNELCARVFGAAGGKRDSVIGRDRTAPFGDRRFTAVARRRIFGLSLGITSLGIASLGIAFLGVCEPAVAQTVVPPAAEGGRIPTPSAPLIQDAPDFVVELLIPDSRRGLSQGDEAAITFLAEDIVVNGATVYPTAEIAQITDPIRGQEISLADLFAVADSLEAKYRADGYILTRVFVPAQRVGDGRFMIQVVEGFVNELLIQGDAGGTRDLLEGYMRAVAEDRPLRSSTLQRYLLLARDLPGVTASGVLRPSGTTTGAAQLVVTVTRKRLDAFAQWDNRASKYTGPNRATLSASGNSLAVAGDRLTGTVLMTQDWDEQRYSEMRYSLPVGSEGARVETSVSYSTSELGFDLHGDELKTKTLIVNMNAGFPLIRSRDRNLNLRGDVTWREVNSRAEEPGNTFRTRDRITRFGLGLQYDQTDSLLGVTSLSVDLYQGANILGAGRGKGEGTPPNPEISRAEGISNFTKVTMDIARLQRLLPNINLLLAFRGQYSFGDKLLSSEEFAIGGEQFGRAYDPGEITGDSGVAGLAEVQVRFVTDGLIVPALESLTFYGSYDNGVVFNYDRDTQGSSSISSFALGLRTNFEAIFNGDVLGFGIDMELAWPLTRPPRTEAPNMPDRFTLVFNSRF